MTWKTPGGERVLSPSEARLFCSCLGTMIDFDRDSGEGLNYGLELIDGPFQRLTDTQKYTVLEEVTTALVTPTPVPMQSALNESAIYYVFSWLRQQFEDPEIGINVWGKNILEALADYIPEEGDEEDAEDFPTVGCEDISKWEDAIEYLADKILWDRDFEMEDMFVNAAPEFYDRANITPGYFAPFAGQAKRSARDSLYQFILPYAP